jgi:hypothetical protein
MQNTAITLNDLEADVKNLEVFITNLNRSRRVLREMKNIIETVQTITGIAGKSDTGTAGQI